MKRQLLFVTARNEDYDDGFSYAIDLARAMKEDITILIAQKKKLMEKFEDMMTAIAFAEAGEHDTAREILSEDNSGKSDERLRKLARRCIEAGINVDVHIVLMDAVPAVKDFLSHQNGIDMVILSPSITSNGAVTAKELNSLVKTASRPVVTMARHVYAQ